MLNGREEMPTAFAPECLNSWHLRMNRACLHVVETLTVTKHERAPTLYGTVFDCGLKRASAEKRKEICDANHEHAETDRCPKVGIWYDCPFYEARPL